MNSRPNSKKPFKLCIVLSFVFAALNLNHHTTFSSSSSSSSSRGRYSNDYWDEADDAVDQPKSIFSFIVASLAAVLEQLPERLRMFGSSAAEEQDDDDDDDETSPTTTTTPNDVRKLKNGGFIHMAKTGGSTISLQLRNGCHSFVPHPCRSIDNETIVSHKVSKYYHIPDFGKLRQHQKQHDFWIISLRDPLDRTISSFVYVHYKNLVARRELSKLRTTAKQMLQQLFRCYPTLESFAQYVGLHFQQYDVPKRINVLPTKQHCRSLARASLQSKVRKFHFLFFGYHNILSFLREGKNTGKEDPTQQQQQQGHQKHPRFFATRQDHLWDDFRQINVLLGHDPDTLQLPTINARDVSNHKLPVTRALSNIGQDYLCNALEHEYRAYIWFLHRAINLTPNDIQQAMEYSIQQCPQWSHLWTSNSQ